MARPQRQALINQIENARGSKVICYLTSDRPNAAAEIQKDVLPFFYLPPHHLSRWSE